MAANKKTSQNVSGSTVNLGEEELEKLRRSIIYSVGTMIDARSNRSHRRASLAGKKIVSSYRADPMRTQIGHPPKV